MRILSLFFGHDTNCALLEDGEPVVVLEKERLSRIKHDQGFMEMEPILETYGWTPDTIDMVVICPRIRPNLDGWLYQWELKGKTYETNPD